MRHLITSAILVLAFAAMGLAVVHHLGARPALSHPSGQDPIPAPADSVSSSGTTADVAVELRLTIGDLPRDLPVGSSIVLYLEDDFAEPDSIPMSSVYLVAENPVSEVTGNGARVYVTSAPMIRIGPYFEGDNMDIGIRVLVPDMCTSATDECEGPNGLNAGQRVTLVFSSSAGIRNPSEAGAYSTGYAILGPVDALPGRGEFTILSELNTWAKIQLSAVRGTRGHDLTVSGSGFSEGVTAAVYVRHDFGVTSATLDGGSNEVALCKRIVREGTRVGGAIVGSDNRVAVTFEVTVPAFQPGNQNFICMIDGTGRMSRYDVEQFHLEPTIRAVPSAVRVGDSASVFAQDFPNTGAGFTELKLAGQTVSISSSSSIGSDGSASVAFVVPSGLAGVVRVEAKWGDVYATTVMTVVASTSPSPQAEGSPPPTSNIRVADGQEPGEVIISWDNVPDATHYRIGYVNMVTDYPLAKASNTGNWLEAFVYVDVEAQNFAVIGGRIQYTIRRLEQGVRHAFTVRTGKSPYGDYTWPSNPRWKFHIVADRSSEACPS